MIRSWSMVLGAVLCCSCANPDIWVPTQREIDDMSYDEAALWLETNLPPLTAVVTTDAITGVRDVVVGECTLTYARMNTRDPITIYLTDVELIRRRSVRPDAAGVEIRWAWVDGRDPSWVRSYIGNGSLASTTFGFYDVQSAVDDADLVVAVLEQIVEVCRGD